MPAVRAAAVALACAIGSWQPAARAQSASGAERDPLAVALPDPMPRVPAEGDRVEPVGDVRRAASAAVDAGSLVALDDRLLRFTLVVTSSGGARNVSLEAIRCDTPERRLLAIGRTDGTWAVTRSSAWQRIRFDDTLHSAHADLYRSLCAAGRPVARDADGLVRALKANPYRIGP